MVKVSVLFPQKADTSFDMDYYCNKHIPMVLKKLGAACKGFSIEEGIGGSVPGTPAPFVAMGHLLFDTVESFQAAFFPHVLDIMGDIGNYTLIPPTIQISEVKMQ